MPFQAPRPPASEIKAAWSDSDGRSHGAQPEALKARNGTAPQLQAKVCFFLNHEPGMCPLMMITGQINTQVMETRPTLCSRCPDRDSCVLMGSRSPTLLASRPSGEGAPRRCSEGLVPARGLSRCAPESAPSRTGTPCRVTGRGCGAGVSPSGQSSSPRSSNHDLSACKSLTTTKLHPERRGKLALFALGGKDVSI